MTVFWPLYKLIKLPSRHLYPLFISAVSGSIFPNKKLFTHYVTSDFLINFKKSETTDIEQYRDAILKICDALQVTPDYLLLGTMHANNISANIMDGLRLCSPEDQALLTNIVELMVKRNGEVWNDENYV